MSPSNVPRLSVVRRSLLLVALALVGPLVSAQTPVSPQQPTPVFRAEASLVPIDARVVDKNGMPITDLTQKDFTVFENGVRQEISQFVKQSLAARPVAAPAPALPRRVNQSTAWIEAQDSRVFLLMLGRGNLRGPVEGIKGLIHLVRERLLPQDRVAVMAWNRATDFPRVRGAVDRPVRKPMLVQGDRASDSQPHRVVGEFLLSPLNDGEYAIEFSAQNGAIQAERKIVTFRVAQ